MDKKKNTKKTFHKDSRSSIKGLHEETLNRLENEKRTNLPILKEELIDLSQNQQTLRREDELRIKEIREKIKSYEQNIEINEYLLKASKHIIQYHKECQKQQEELINSDTDEDEEDNKSIKSFVIRHGSKKLGSIYNRYIEDCQDQIIDEQTDYINYNIISTCGNCGKDKLVIDEKNAIAICENCAHTITYQDNNSYNQWSDECETLSPFAYKRINHLKEWLTQLQAKETTEIPEEIIEKLLIELKKERITDAKYITNSKIKVYLKKLKLNKYYEHVPTIIRKLCGIPPRVMSKELEERLMNKFKQLQIPFENNIPEGRKNFLSYSYTLHKLCQLEGEYQFLECFPLLKSREKLYHQDCMWKKMCQELNWKFIPSV